MRETLISQAMQVAQQGGVSDIHLSTRTGLHFRYRGSVAEAGLDDTQQALLQRITDPVAGREALIQEVIDVIAPEGEFKDGAHRHLRINLESFAERMRNGHPLEDLNDVIQLGERGSWRLNLYPSDVQGLGLALRHLPPVIPTLKELIPGPLLSYAEAPLTHAMSRKEGLFLVTGTTGSGKSSTLAALVNLINTTQARKIITLEDPVEFWHTSRQSIVHHRQIGVDVESFELGLRAAMRQDPDVILLGELRDLETISRALTATETGHLVLATLHSRNVAASITRLVDVFPSERQPMVRAQLASSLIGIMSQELVPSSSPAAEKFGGRVVIPEIAVLNDRPGGVRAPIHDGRFNEIGQNLELIRAGAESLYLTAERSKEILHGASFL